MKTEEEEKEQERASPTEQETSETEQNLILHIQKTTKQEHNIGKGQAKEESAKYLGNTRLRKTRPWANKRKQ